MNEPTNDNDIDALLRYLLTSGHTQHWNDDSARWRAALTALVAERDALQEENIALRSRQKSHQDEVLDRVFEMDALRKRIAELEANPPASDLRDRLVCAIWPEMLRIYNRLDPDGKNWDLVRCNATTVTLMEVDAMLKAMRQGGGA